MKKNLIAFSIICLFSFPALRALAIPGFYTNHDGLTHTARIASYYQALLDGQIPPRWAGNFFGKMGTPIFNFIYPLPYFFGSLFHFIGFSFTDSFEIVIALGYIFSGIFFYLWLQQFFPGKAAFLGSLFYLWAPYRFSQIYVRGAYAESLGYTFLPLVFYALTKLNKHKNKRKWFTISSLSMALLLLSHQLVSFIFLPIILIYIFILWWTNTNKERKLSVIIYNLSIVFFGFLVSSFIYFPDIFERQFIRYSGVMKYYEGHFVTLKQLIHSPWGYGFSHPGTLNDAMSFQIGLTHILVILLIIVYGLLFIVCNREKILRAKLFQNENFLLSALFFTLFSFSIIFMLENPLTKFLWKHLPFIKTIDFPWRLLGVSVFSSAFLTAFLTTRIKSKLLYLLLLFLIFYANRNHLRINQPVYYDDHFFYEYQGDATWMHEFLPKERNSVAEQFWPKEKVSNFDKEIKIDIKQEKSNFFSFATESTESGIIRISRFYFPGWQAFMDNQKLTLNKEFKIAGNTEKDFRQKQDVTGLFEVNIPAGSHRFVLKWIETPLRKIANFISLFTFGGLLCLLVKRK